MCVFVFVFICLLKTIGGFYQCVEVNNNSMTSAVMILSLIINREWLNERTEISFECCVSMVTSPVHLYFTCVVQKRQNCLLQRVSYHRPEYKLQQILSVNLRTDRQVSLNVRLTVFIRQ